MSIMLKVCEIFQFLITEQSVWALSLGRKPRQRTVINPTSISAEHYFHQINVHEKTSFSPIQYILSKNYLHKSNFYINQGRIIFTNIIIFINLIRIPCKTPAAIYVTVTLFSSIHTIHVGLYTLQEFLASIQLLFIS